MCTVSRYLSHWFYIYTQILVKAALTVVRQNAAAHFVVLLVQSVRDARQVISVRLRVAAQHIGTVNFCDFLNLVPKRNMANMSLNKNIQNYIITHLSSVSG